MSAGIPSWARRERATPSAGPAKVADPALAGVRQRALGKCREMLGQLEQGVGLTGPVSALPSDFRCLRASTLAAAKCPPPASAWPKRKPAPPPREACFQRPCRGLLIDWLVHRM